MSVSSPLAILTDVLVRVANSAGAYEDSLRANEHVTRAVLVDPVLRALGWDTANPFRVEVEKSIVDGRVDYALNDSNGEIRAIVEAKKLGADLSGEKVYLSIINYAFAAKVNDVFLTDGLVWHHYDAFDPKGLEPPKVLNLSGGSLIDAAAYFINVLDAARYWPDQEDVDDLSHQMRQLESEIADIRKSLALVSAKFPDHILDWQVGKVGEAPEPPAENFVPLARIEDATGTKPSQLLLPDGTTIQVRSWNELLRECAKATLAPSPSVPVPLQDKAGKNVQLLSKSRPPKGISYFEMEYRGESVFLYTNYDANNCIANAHHLLRYFPDDQQRVEAGAVYSKY